MGSESGSERINLADTSEFNDLLDVVESGLDTDAQVFLLPRFLGQN